jgi:hypothetical protein
MIRQASIHITEEYLKELIKKHMLTEALVDIIDEKSFNESIRNLMYDAKKKSLESRNYIINTKKLEKKVTSKTIDDKTDISLLAHIIFTVRQSFKHRGIKPIDNNSHDWVSLKKLVPVVNNFCNEFGFIDKKKREGYIEYIKTGLLKITSYRGYIIKLYDMSEVISNEYQSKVDILNDPNLTITI